MQRLRAAALACSAILAVAACGSPGPSVIPTSTGPASSAAPGESPSVTAPPPTEATSEAPATPPATSGPPGGSPAPSSSAAPSVDSLKVQRTADCNADNGTGTVGMVRVTWTASGTTGVRISIDPPSPDVAYGYGYADYPASGFADVPFACDPPNHDAKGDYHLYVVTTLHDKGYFFYRYARVYATTPGPTP